MEDVVRDGAYVGVDGAELPAPLGVVEEGPVVETVVVRTVRLGVHGRRDHRHLVPVDGVAAVKVFHLRRGGGGGRSSLIVNSDRLLAST